MSETWHEFSKNSSWGHLAYLIQKIYFFKDFKPLRLVLLFVDPCVVVAYFSAKISFLLKMDSDDELCFLVYPSAIAKHLRNIQRVTSLTNEKVGFLYDL